MITFIITFVLSMIFGILPDVLYSFLYIKNIKNLKNKKALFFVLLFVSYMLCIILIQHQLYFYIALDIITYLIMKLLYKVKINDFFLIILLDLYLVICSLLSYVIFGNYVVAMIVYRVLLFIPLLFKNKLRKIYKEYCRLWNRHNEKDKIKSITIRNIVLTLLNGMIILFYLVLSYISNILG